MISVRAAALCVLALTSTASVAYAQAALPRVPEPPRADRNGDGKVTLPEYQDSRRTYLMRADKDKNGQITKAEWDRAARDIRNSLELNGVEGADLVGQGSWWTAIDADKSGVIDAAEIDAMTKARFHRYDANHDGFIQRAEAEKIRKTAQASIR